MRIAVVGAGGVGGYYGAVLARAGHDVGLLARGDHLAGIRDGGLRIALPDGSGFTARVRASDRVEDLVEAGLALVAVKAYSLPEVAPAVVRLAEAGAIILPLLNGVDIVDRLRDAGVPGDALLAGLTYISAARTGPGRIERRSDFQRIALGEPPGRAGGSASERAHRVAAAFDATDVDVTVPDDIELELWRKFVFIAGISAVCGLSRTAIGPVRDTAGGVALIRRAVAEVVDVARARGVALKDDAAETVSGRILELDPALKPSFLLDVEAGGPAELDVLSGTVSRLGAAADVDTPVHDTAVAAIAAALA